jgi:hypothetical protein
LTSTVDFNELLFVIGVHRSGTSALCAALAACGVSFGDQLIAPMAGVNDEGFWEDAGVVAINEQLLVLADATWYTPSPALMDTDWADSRFQPLRDQALRLLRARLVSGSLQAVKDPRFSLTLPFWRALCKELDIVAHVCVINRAPLEVARSLERRDGFPLGFGLRLFANYRSSIDRFADPGTAYIRYDDLLQDPQAVIASLAKTLPLNTVNTIAGAVRRDLRHQVAGQGSELLTQADSGTIDLAALADAIEASYPQEQTLRDFAGKFTARGVELAQIGDAHSAALATLEERDGDIESLSAEHRSALATIDERDADIESLSGEHRAALATIGERDEQIREFDRRLSKLGEEHSHALQVLRERDAELAWIKQRLDAVSKVPGVGYLIRRLRKHAQS